MSKRALVLGITRLGDLVQTEPMIRTLKRSKSVDYVDLLVERSFRDIASQLECVDQVHEVDFRSILGRLDQGQATLPLKSYLELSGVVSSEQYSRVINVTHSRPSMVLASLARSPVDGVTMDREGLQIVNNAWLQYFFATNLARPWCSFNLVDIYVNAIDHNVRFEDRRSRLDGKCPIKSVKCRDFVGMSVLLHVGASQSNKQWPLDRFVDLAESLLDRGAMVTLIGTGNDALVKCFPANRRLHSLIGQTSVRELVEVCDQADLMISADSGPVHVAAARNLPLVVIEGGSAHGFETAPYIEGAYVVQPHLHDLMSRIPGKQVTSASALNVSGETVLSTIEHFLGGSLPICASSQCTVYRTKAGTTIPGLELEAICGANIEYEEWQRSLRFFWYQAISETLSGKSKRVNPLTEAFKDAAEACSEVSNAGMSINKLEQAATLLSIAEQKLSHLIKKTPPLYHVNAFLQIARSSVSGSLPNSQAEELKILYLRMAKASEVLTNRLSETIPDSNQIKYLQEEAHEDLH